jgi:acyl transferase domain-containing protein/acyl carrier protein
MNMNHQERTPTGLEIAVIGMSGRFPGAGNIDQFWQNLKNGVESISYLTHQELLEKEVPEKLVDNPDFINARGGILHKKDYFDASFFDYTPKEAAMMDPQLRIMHECCWSSLENAGYNPDSYDGAIGIYAGAALNLNWHALSIFSGKIPELGDFAVGQLTDKDFLCTRTAYKLNLKGPAIAVHTACSTGLVAIHLASRALLTKECNIALAGGISIFTDEKNGYLYQEGMIGSPDGHCRPFDARGKGTISGSGVGIVVLKRLKQALEDHDHIYAVILGSAVNNDGMQKVGFTAPSIDGQLGVIKTAQFISGVKPESISYIETHGTGTPLGDPIEIEALKQAFNTSKRHYCRIGSVKSNIGHLGSAAGVTGFIKTVLALAHKQIPPSLHFETANPKIDFDHSPFIVNNQLHPWQHNGNPLRAGVSSFGIGGTNAHIVLQQAPPKSDSLRHRNRELLLLSAKTQTALQQSATDLAHFLKRSPRTNLADIAYTQMVGRKAFDHRRKLVCSSVSEAIQLLESQNSRQIHSFVTNNKRKSLVFMFPGLGAQYTNMGLQLYENEPLFRKEVDHCFEILAPLLDFNIKDILYPGPEASPSPGEMDRIEVSQLVIFILGYALGRLLMAFGITPDAMIGYSIGEYVAACLAGVFSLQHALQIIVKRGELVKKIPGGAMLSVPLEEEKLRPLIAQFKKAAVNLDPSLLRQFSLAIDNGPSCIVSGPKEVIAAFETHLKQEKLVCIRLKAAHAIHSPMMEPLMAEFEKEVSQATLQEPKIPFVANVTGEWVVPQEVATANYWARHLGQTVHFAEGIKRLLEKKDVLFVEVGPARDLCTLLSGQFDDPHRQQAVNLVRHPGSKALDHHYLLSKIGQLWLYGAQIDARQFYSQENRSRIPLPSYPFEGQSYWLEHDPANVAVAKKVQDSHMKKKKDTSDWFYSPTWSRVYLQPEEILQNQDPFTWLVFRKPHDFCSQFIHRLEAKGNTVVTVTSGDRFGGSINSGYTINPQASGDYLKLFKQLQEQGKLPNRIVHFWSITGTQIGDNHFDAMKVEESLEYGFYSLLYLARALGRQNIMAEIELEVVTDHMHEVTGGEGVAPWKASLMGPLKVIPQEYSFIVCRNVDIILPQPGSAEMSALVNQLFDEFTTRTLDTVIAYRGLYRWVQTYRPVRIGKAQPNLPQLKEKGVYMITGGLGNVGLTLARHLADSVNARLILISRSHFPGPEEWQDYLESHPDGDATTAKIQKLQEIAANAGDILIRAVDVTDLSAMQQVISDSEMRFGPINGVIHAAGNTGDSIMKAIEQVEQNDCDAQFKPKIYGLLTLEKVLRNKPLDFCWLTSSLSPILGGLGFSAYAAANHFMDAFVHWYRSQSPVRWISINWADWEFNKDGAAPTEESGRHSWRMLPEEGIETFRRILSHCRESQIVVSTVDLQTRLDQWVKLESIREDHGQKELTTSYRSRPQLESAYVKPANPVELAIVDVLQDFLGIEEVGIDDNFFELGATSLNIIQINSKVREILKRDISVVSWFEYPTTRSLSEHLDQEGSGQKVETQKIDRSKTMHKGKNKLKQMKRVSRSRIHDRIRK